MMNDVKRLKNMCQTAFDLAARVATLPLRYGPNADQSNTLAKYAKGSFNLAADITLDTAFSTLRHAKNFYGAGVRDASHIGGGMEMGAVAIAVLTGGSALAATVSNSIGHDSLGIHENFKYHWLAVNTLLTTAIDLRFVNEMPEVSYPRVRESLQAGQDALNPPTPPQPPKGGGAKIIHLADRRPS